ncbi:hypothetical protein Q5M85_07875 [Paraclostridium bifermentans]|nr:hypothetical protein [Paraclostridium bifermentans]
MCVNDVVLTNLTNPMIIDMRVKESEKEIKSMLDRLKESYKVMK